MSGRLFERKKRRMPCSVTFDGRKHSGLVLDVSPGGLFVQTSAKAEPGDRLDLNLSIPGEEQMVHMQVEVARKVVVPPRLRTVAHGGIGEADDDGLGLLGLPGVHLHLDLPGLDPLQGC